MKLRLGFANIVVHGYGDVNLDVLRDILDNHLGDLEVFAQAIRGLLKDHCAIGHAPGSSTPYGLPAAVLAGLWASGARRRVDCR